MSVQVLDLESYQNVFVKAVDHSYTNTSDINFCSAFYHMKNEDDIKKLITTWCHLNELSFVRAYEKGEANLHKMLNLKYDGKTIDTYQMLKTLECIKYNIEIDTIEQGRRSTSPKMELTFEQKEAYKTLCKIIDEIQTTVIDQIPQYKDAKWG